jgi:hypothetical protein
MAVAVLIRVPVTVVMVVVVAIVGMPVAMVSLRAMVRNVSSTDIMVAVVAIVVVVFLGERCQGEDHSRCKDAGKQFH